MKELEQIVENLLTATLQRTQNVEEVVYNLQAFYHYSLRETLYPLVEKHTVELWTMLMQNIHTLKQELVEEHKYRPLLWPLFGGKAMMAHIKRQKLIGLKGVNFLNIFNTQKCLFSLIRLEYLVLFSLL